MMMKILDLLLYIYLKENFLCRFYKGFQHNNRLQNIFQNIFELD